MDHSEQAAFDFLCRHYVQRADDRQKAIGLQYIEAETHDLAEAMVKFFRSTSSGVIADLAAERARQIEAEGWTRDHDDEHTDGSLASAAACYATGNNRLTVSGPIKGTSPSSGWSKIWPWAPDSWKPKDRRCNLIRAGALIVAEIERLDRAAAKQKD